MTVQQLATILKNEVIKGRGKYPIYFRVETTSYPVLQVRVKEAYNTKRLEMTWFVEDK